MSGMRIESFRTYIMAVINKLTPMLETKSIQETIAFYKDVVHFTLDSYNEQWGWEQVSKDEISIMISLPNAHRNMKGPIMSGSLYMNVHDVESIWNNIKDKCKICYPPEQFDYGMREFGVYDNNRYLLQFGEEV